MIAKASPRMPDITKEATILSKLPPAAKARRAPTAAVMIAYHTLLCVVPCFLCLFSFDCCSVDCCLVIDGSEGKIFIALQLSCFCCTETEAHRFISTLI